MDINHTLLEMGIVQFSNREENVNEGKLLDDNYPIYKNFQNQRTVDACELFRDDEKYVEK